MFSDFSIQQLTDLGFVPLYEGAKDKFRLILYRNERQDDTLELRAIVEYQLYKLIDKNAFKTLVTAYDEASFIEQVERVINEKENQGYSDSFIEIPTNILDVEAPNEVVEDESSDVAETLNQSENYPYRPASQNPFSLKVHTPMSMAFETEEALRKLVQDYGDVDEFVRQRLHYPSKEAMWAALAGEQIDGIAFAIYNFEKEQGFIIGDQTGIGKGRQAAAMIRYAVENGLPALFVTATTDLLSDMYRDLKDIGCGHYVPYVLNNENIVDADYEIKGGESKKANEVWRIKNNTKFKGKTNANHQENLDGRSTLPQGYHYVMATYSQFIEDEEAKKKGHKSKGKKGFPKIVEAAQAKTAFVRRYTAGGIVVLDEAHKASGEGSNTGYYFEDIAFYAAGVAFLSATYAKRPDNMGIYAMKTAISEAGVSQEALKSIFELGGVVLQEVVASELTRNGQMLRRQRPFDGISVDYLFLEDEKSERHIELYDTVMSLVEKIVFFQGKYMIKALKKYASDRGIAIKQNSKGVPQVGTNDTFSQLHNITSQLLFALKAADVAEIALEQLRQNKKVVIAFRSTNETFLKELNVRNGEVLSNFNFAYLIQRLLDKTFTYNLGTAEKPKIIKIDPEEYGGDMLQAYESLSEEIHNFGQKLGVMSVSPIDDIINRIESEFKPAGLGGGSHERFVVRECTGRSGQIKIENGEPIYYSRKADKKRFFKEFNNGACDVLLINKSASTGVSAHALYKVKDTRKRVMIIHQPELDINEEIQKRGRINRTGQVVVSGVDYFMPDGKTPYPVHISSKKPNAENKDNTEGYWIDLSDNKTVKSFVNGQWVAVEGAKENLPEYIYVSTKIPSEKRLFMVLKRKLKSLDANTTGNQKANESQLDSDDDFFNKYGDEVIDIIIKKDKEGEKKFARYFGNSKGVNQATNHISLAPVELQELFYQTVLEAYNRKIKKLKQEGLYDLELVFYDYKAKELATSMYATTNTPSPTTTFGLPAIQSVAEVNIIRKPLPFSKIKALCQQNIGKLSVEEHREYILSEYAKYVESELGKLTEITELRKRNVVQDYDDKTENRKNRVTELEFELKKLGDWQNSDDEKLKKKALTQLAKIEKATNEYEAMVQGRSAKINEIEAEILKNIEEKKSTFQYTKEALSSLRIGMPTKSLKHEYDGMGKIIATSYYNAIVIDFGFNFNAKNPFTPANTFVVVAVSHPDRLLDYNFHSYRSEIGDLIKKSRMSPREKEAILVDWNNAIPKDKREIATFIKVNPILALKVIGKIKEDLKATKSWRAKDTVASSFNGIIVKYSDDKGGVQVGVELNGRLRSIEDASKETHLPLNDKAVFEYIASLEYNSRFHISSADFISIDKIMKNGKTVYVVTVSSKGQWSDVWGNDKILSLLISDNTGRKEFVRKALLFEGTISDSNLEAFLQELFNVTGFSVAIENYQAPMIQADTPKQPKGEYQYRTENYNPNTVPQTNLINVDGTPSGLATLTYEYPLSPSIRFEQGLIPVYGSLEEVYRVWETALNELQLKNLEQVLSEAKALPQDRAINRLGLFITQNQHEVGQPIYVFGDFAVSELAKKLYSTKIGKVERRHPLFEDLSSVVQIMRAYLKAA